jgi:hypothetical protein
MRRNLKNKKGQVAVEFILVSVVVFFFIFFFASISILIVTSEYIEYATFMAARTYKSMFGSPEVQQRNAQLVFDSYKKNVEGIARNFKLEFVNGDSGNQDAGVVVQYDIDMFYLPPVFLKNNQPSRIQLTSEAHLGRDSTNAECQQFFNEFSQRAGLGLDGSALINQMEDNGC